MARQKPHTPRKLSSESIPQTTTRSSSKLEAPGSDADGTSLGLDLGYTTLGGRGPEHQMFDNVSNFRDVGAVVNREMGVRVMREGVLFRSGMLDDASTRDKQRLTSDFHLSTILDLRSSTEHQVASKRRFASFLDDITVSATQETPAPEPAVPPTPTGTEHLLNFEGVRRIMISLVGWRLHKTLVWRLSWWNFTKFLSLISTGYRTDAIKLLTTTVMQRRGLIGLAEDTLAASTLEIKQILTHLADRTTYPTVIHCSQGKDRTGLVVVLLLLLLSEPDSNTSNASNDESKKSQTQRIPLSAISADYNLSDRGLRGERNEWIEELRKVGLGPEFAVCADGFVGAVKRVLDERYGGIGGYLRGIGVGEDVVDGIRGVLLVEEGGE